MSTFRLINVQFDSVCCRTGNMPIARGMIVNVETSEYVCDMDITEERTIAALLNANSEEFERLTTFTNCEIAEVKIGNHICKRIVPCLE